jgi:hypothetical protein
MSRKTWYPRLGLCLWEGEEELLKGFNIECFAGVGNLKKQLTLDIEEIVGAHVFPNSEEYAVENRT